MHLSSILELFWCMMCLDLPFRYWREIDGRLVERWLGPDGVELCTSPSNRGKM